MKLLTILRYALLAIDVVATVLISGGHFHSMGYYPPMEQARTGLGVLAVGGLVGWPLLLPHRAPWKGLVKRWQDRKAAKTERQQQAAAQNSLHGPNINTQSSKRGLFWNKTVYNIYQLQAPGPGSSRSPTIDPASPSDE
ncbi:MAG: hypothetical protein QOD77_1772 [Thermoplasmata archaeon]|jgi:hypothetical protein|nr:hypothetical protein [Thermoplasmata archaeon]